MQKLDTKLVTMPTDFDGAERLAYAADHRPRMALAPADLNADQRIVYLYGQIKKLKAGTATATVKTTPPAPTVTTPLTASGVGATFTFTPVASPSTDPDPPVGYHVYRNPNANSFSGASRFRYFPESATASIQVDDPLAAQASAYYWVTTVSASGAESAPSAAQATSVPSGSIVAANGSVVVGGVTAADASGNLVLKNVAQGVASTAGPTTTSGTPSVIAEMTQTVTTKGNKVLIVFNGTFQVSVLAGLLGIFIYRDGVSIGYENLTSAPGASYFFPSSISWIDNPSAASHTYDVRWNISSGTATAVGTDRALQVVELG